MAIDPIPCLVTTLDALEIDDLKRRLESLVTRILASSDPTRSGLSTSGFISDRHGRIVISQSGGAILTINADAWDGMGSLNLAMPMPAGGDREATASRMTRADLVRLLTIWLGFLDSPPASNDADLGGSGFARMIGQISALLRAANPDIGPGARISITAPPAWPEEGATTSSAFIPAIANGRSKPILAPSVEARILSLHPGATIERSRGTRAFHLHHAPTMTVPISDPGPLGIMRALADLDVQMIRKPVLAAGLALR